MVLSRVRTQTRFVVLPPSRIATISSHFRNVRESNQHYDELLAKMQRFRGGVYLNDGAVTASELIDGRHKAAVDEQSWHVLSLDSSDNICACLRYLEERQATSFNDLWVRHAALAQASPFAAKFRRAVEAEMARAREMRIGFGEVGGWAVAESHRWTLEPLRIILATYGLLQLHGGCAGVATATFRHSSAGILRRIGLNPLMADGAPLPPYFDPAYGCQMEVLSFDSRFPNSKYRESVQELMGALTGAEVVARERKKSTLHRILRGFEAPAVERRTPATMSPATV